MCSTRLSFVLKPSFSSVLLTASATLFAGAEESPTTCSVSRPGVFPARITGELHVLFGDRHVAGRVFVVVDLRARIPAGFFEAGDAVPEEVRHHVGDGLAAAQPVERFAIGRRPQRLAQVDVLERAVAVVDRDVAVSRAAAGRDRELAGVLLHGELQDRRGGRVRLDHVAAFEHLAADHVRVAADRDVDLVEVGRAEVGARAPVRVAHERRRLTGLVADSDDLAFAVVLQHVRPGRDLVVGVFARFLGVELRGVFLRHGSAPRQHHRGDHDRRLRFASI